MFYKSRRYEVIALANHFGSRDLEIKSMSLNVELDHQIMVIHMRSKYEGPNSRRYEVIAFTSHFSFRDLVTLKSGRGH